MLRALTEAIVKQDGTKWVGGFLGGEFGYGARWDSEVFLMRPFCWCERDDCPWCCGCECPESSYHYFVDGREVPYQAYAEFFDRETYHRLSGGKIKNFSASLKRKEDEFYTHEQWMDAANKANERRTTRHDPECAFCKGEFPSPNTGAIGNGEGAPNFWHKPSGLRVWWYKYIGRDLKFDGPCTNLSVVLRECLADVDAQGTSAREG